MNLQIRESRRLGISFNKLWQLLTKVWTKPKQGAGTGLSCYSLGLPSLKISQIVLNEIVSPPFAIFNIFVCFPCLLSAFYYSRKHTLNCHRMKPALFSVLCEIKEKTGKLNCQLSVTLVLLLSLYIKLYRYMLACNSIWWASGLVILLDYYNPCDKHQRSDISSYYEDVTYRSLVLYEWNECIGLDTICFWISTLLATSLLAKICVWRVLHVPFLVDVGIGPIHALQNNKYAQLLNFKIGDICISF